MGHQVYLSAENANAVMHSRSVMCVLACGYVLLHTVLCSMLMCVCVCVRAYILHFFGCIL